MRPSQLARRYAHALYNLARESQEQDVVLDQMRALDDAFASDPAVGDFIGSPLVRPVDKEKAFTALTQAIPLNETLKRFLLLLAKKNRLGLLGGVVGAFQMIADEAHGVTRGVVRSATALGPTERERIAELVSRATKKQVILTYKEDPSLLGGLVAEVGSYTFDDSLVSHLNRINEQITRSVQ